jgi:hypothetical protein
MTSSYSIPGVYYEPRPRTPPRPMPRTDVVGFIGFEPRVQDGTTPSTLTGSPPVGHAFRVDVLSFLLPQHLLDGIRATTPAAQDLVLSQSATAIPIAAGGSIRYALVAVVSSGGLVQWIVVPGLAFPAFFAAPATDDSIRAVAGAQRWVRVADIDIRRSPDGLQVFPVVIPSLPPARCDDWTDFVLKLGGLPLVEDGTMLARSVRAFFANGGSRCHIETVRRPHFDDVAALEDSIADMVGIQGSSELEATGLERLLCIFEVAIVDIPDLYARQVVGLPQSMTLPPLDIDACFQPCRTLTDTGGLIASSGGSIVGQPIFADADVLDAQQKMLTRCAPERWRVLLLLTSPVALDPATGVYLGPDAARAIAWRQQLTMAMDDLTTSVAAFYHPWALTQESIGAPSVEVPPTGLAAGIIARRDIARGPHIAPANERLISVVGLTNPVDDATNTLLYAPPMNINPLRAFPGIGIQVWGARTLSGDTWMRYLPVRRCLSAIERKALVALRPLVFEPNTPTLWFQITQAVLAVLVPIFNAGALRGDTTDDAFYVRCDATNNPPESIAVGQVLCEVGVAIAAPAEFIVFRVGRQEGVVEVTE